MYQIIQKNDAKLEVQSQIGEGTSFFVLFLEETSSHDSLDQTDSKEVVVVQNEKS